MEEWYSGKLAQRKRMKNGVLQIPTPQDPELNPQVWGRTTMDIQIHILTFLPLPALCRFKSVSKAWHSAIGDGTLDFKFKKQKWYIMPGFRCLGLLDGNAGSVWRIEVPRYDVVVSSSAPGLVAARLDKPSPAAAVFNPLVQSSWIQLPHPPQVTRWPETGGNRHVVSFGFQSAAQADDGRVSFIVVQLLGFSPRDGDESYELEVQVYSSTAGEWTSSPVPAQVLGHAGEKICINTIDHEPMVLREDQLYFITVSRNNTRSLKSMNVWNPCNLRTIATWTTLPRLMNQPLYERVANLSFPGVAFWHCRLVHCAGKLVLVGMIPFELEEFLIDNYEDEDERLGTVGLLTLDEKQAHKGWQLLASLPAEILLDNLRNGLEMENRLYAAASEDEVTVFLCDYSWGCIYNLTNRTCRSAFGNGFMAQAFFPFSPSLANLEPKLV